MKQPVKTDYSYRDFLTNRFPHRQRDASDRRRNKLGHRR